MEPLGLYLSIPFCRAKCSFCNFASDAFAPGRLPQYVDQLCREIGSARTTAARLEAELPDHVDTVYLGGGTPSLLAPGDVRRIFTSLRNHFVLAPDAEITVECAPNQLPAETLEEFQRQGLNRLSFGVQSFVDVESSAIGRLHTARQCLAEIERVRSAGVLNLSLDLIAGLPHQTASSWRQSLEAAIASGVPHLSIYMLEVDEDSRLGREVLASGSRYGAASVPSDDDSALFYETACHLLEAAGIPQYEISNFARPGFASVHNLKYWQRKPYLGVGLDAHSMLRTAPGAVRFANGDRLEQYLGAAGDGSREAKPLAVLPNPAQVVDRVTQEQAFEESLFLGLRMNAGLSLDTLLEEFGAGYVNLVMPALFKAEEESLLSLHHRTIRLTARGRALSNEVFSRLLIPSAA